MRHFIIDFKAYGLILVNVCIYIQGVVISSLLKVHC